MPTLSGKISCSRHDVAKTWALVIHNDTQLGLAIAVDETPVVKHWCQQLDVMARYFSEVTKQGVVEHLESFRLGRAAVDVVFNKIPKTTQELN